MSAPRSTILVVDDADDVRRLLEETLGESHLVKTAPGGEAALALAREAPPPDLILIDTKLAGASGYELCKALRALPGLAEVPVIFLAERRYPQDLVQAFRLGAIDFFVKPLPAPALCARIEARLEQLAHERTAQLQGSEQRVARLVRAMQWHDSSLGGKRTRRLAEYARALAEAAGAREVACALLMRAAQLHDVGKLGVPAELLRKERTLSGAEREQFERHAAVGAEIIGEHDDALLKLARTVALTHHERWDGAGYPGRLQGSQIPWAGRVMAIVDAFESMTAPPHGGSAMSIERAVAEIGAAAGQQFDPVLVEALRKALPAFRKVHEAHAEQPADAADDFVIGAAAEQAGRSAAPDDDLVIGGPAAGAVDESELTMIGPLRLGGGAPSNEKLREAIQRAVAKTQALKAARRLKEEEQEQAPERSAETPAPAPERSAAKAEFEALRDRVKELKTEQAQLHAQNERLQARVKELEVERAAAQAGFAQAQELARAELEALRAQVKELETARAATAGTQSELARRAEEREAAEERHRAEQAQLHAQIESLHARVKELDGECAAAQAALSQWKAQLEGERAEQARLDAQTETLHARVKELEGERAAAQAALAQSKADLEGARAEQAQFQAQLQALRARVRELETERATTAAALAQARAEFSDLQAAAPVEAQSELARLTREREAAEERHRAEQAQLHAQIESLRAGVKGLEGERAAAREAAHELERRREAAELALSQLEARRRAAEAALGGERERTRIAAEREAAEVKAAHAAKERPYAEELLSVLFAAQAASRREVAEASDRRAAVVAGEAAKPARRSRPTVTLIAFVLGALALAVAYLALHGVQVLAPAPILQPAPVPQRAGRRASIAGGGVALPQPNPAPLTKALRQRLRRAARGRAASSSTSAAARAERAMAGSPRTRAAESAPSVRSWSWVARASACLMSRRWSRARNQSRRCSLNRRAMPAAACFGSESSATALI